MQVDSYFPAGVPLSQAGDAGRQAAEAGFDAIWLTETRHNPFLSSAAALAATEHLRADAGIAVAFPRSPTVTAQAAWDLAELGRGQFVLGLGTQVKAHVVRRFSAPFDQPVARLREYIHALRAIFRAFQGQEKLGFSGDFYQFSLPRRWRPAPDRSRHLAKACERWTGVVCPRSKQSSGSACWPFVPNGRPGNREDPDEAIQTDEVVGIRREQRQPLGDGRGGDHQVHDSAPRLTSGRHDRCRHAAEDAGRLGVEWDRVKFVLGTLQDLKAPRALGMLVISVLLVVAAHLVRASRQLRQRYGADRHLIGQLSGVDPATQDQDVGVEHALPVLLTAHTRCQPHDRAPRPDQP